MKEERSVIRQVCRICGFSFGPSLTLWNGDENGKHGSVEGTI